MGAASSFPAQISKDQAAALSGAEAWARVEAKWPEGELTITREALEALVAGDEAVASVVKGAAPMSVEDQVVGPSATPSKPPVDEAPAADGDAPARAKVELEKREAFDAAAARRAKIAKENGVDAATLAATPAKAARPPRAPGSSVKKGKEQSSQLRQLLKAQRRAAKAEGRPPSRGMDEVECMLYVKPEGGAQTTPQVMTLGESDEPTVQAAPEILAFDSEAEGTPSVGLPEDVAAVAAPAEPAAAAATKADPPVVAGAAPVVA